MVSAEPFSHGTGTLRCLQKKMATYRHSGFPAHLSKNMGQQIKFYRTQLIKYRTYSTMLIRLHGKVSMQCNGGRPHPHLLLCYPSNAWFSDNSVTLHCIETGLWLLLICISFFQFIYFKHTTTTTTCEHHNRIQTYEILFCLTVTQIIQLHCIGLENMQKTL